MHLYEHGMIKPLSLLLMLLLLTGCEIIRVQLRNPITTSVMLEPGSLDPLVDKLAAIDANLTDAKADFKVFVTWISSGGGVAAFLGLSGTGGYMWVRKRKKNGDGD